MLGKDTISHILTFLDFNEIARFSKTNKRNNEIVKINYGPLFNMLNNWAIVKCEHKILEVDKHDNVDIYAIKDKTLQIEVISDCSVYTYGHVGLPIFNRPIYHSAYNINIFTQTIISKGNRINLSLSRDSEYYEFHSYLLIRDANRITIINSKCEIVKTCLINGYYSHVFQNEHMIKFNDVIIFADLRICRSKKFKDMVYCDKDIIIKLQNRCINSTTCIEFKHCYDI